MTKLNFQFDITLITETEKGVKIRLFNENIIYLFINLKKYV